MPTLSDPYCMCGGGDTCMRDQGWHVHTPSCAGEDGWYACGQRAYGEEPPVPTCPHCGSDQFTLGRAITVYQTLDIRMLDHKGNFDIEHDELHDTLEEGDFEDAAQCAECGKEVPLRHLGLTPTPRKG